MFRPSPWMPKFDLSLNRVVHFPESSGHGAAGSKHKTDSENTCTLGSVCYSGVAKGALCDWCPLGPVRWSAKTENIQNSAGASAARASTVNGGLRLASGSALFGVPRSCTVGAPRGNRTGLTRPWLLCVVACTLSPRLSGAHPAET